MANSFWMATAEGGGGRANGSREGRPVLSHSTLQREQIQYPLLCQIASLIFVDRRLVPDVSIGCGPALSSESETHLPLPFSVSFHQSTQASIKKKKKGAFINAHESSLWRMALPSTLATSLSQDICPTPWVPPMPRQHAASIYHMSLAIGLVGINVCVLKKEDLCGTLQVKGSNPSLSPYGRGVGHQVRQAL